MRNPAFIAAMTILCSTSTLQAQGTGLEWPAGWPDLAAWDFQIVLDPLPSRYVWDDTFPAMDVRNQLSCGACWAFGTIAALEYQLLIQDRKRLNLSEDWLLDCNLDGWDCDGGWAGCNYLSTNAPELDSCGRKGAPVENVDPYTPGTVNCNCPATARYTISDWKYIGLSGLMATTEQIKYAIMQHGPVISAVNAANWSGFNGSVFTDCEVTIDPGDLLDLEDPPDFLPNHIVVIVGWDDTIGGGSWRVRNQWGSGWGDGGYVWMPYGCSWIGFGAHYLEYPIGEGVWVEAGYTGSKLGTFAKPFETIAEGMTPLAAGGTLSLKGGDYNEPGTYDASMTLMGYGSSSAIVGQ